MECILGLRLQKVTKALPPKKKIDASKVYAKIQQI